MLEKANEKAIYKTCIVSMIGSEPIEGVDKGVYIMCI